MLNLISTVAPATIIYGRGYVGSLISSAFGKSILQSIKTPVYQAGGLDQIVILASGPSSVLAGRREIDEYRSALNRWTDWKRELPLSIIYISSAGGVYGDTGRFQLDEQSRPVPATLYGEYQLWAESILQERFEDRLTILRVSNLYGPLQLPKTNQGFVSAVIRSFFQDKELLIYGDGGNERDYLYEADFIAAIRAVMHRPRPGIYNVASEQIYTQKDVVNTACRLFGKNIEPKYLPARGEDVKAVYVSNEKFRITFNWRPAYLLEDGLLEYRKALR